MPYTYTAEEKRILALFAPFLARADGRQDRNMLARRNSAEIIQLHRYRPKTTPNPRFAL